MAKTDQILASSSSTKIPSRLVPAVRLFWIVLAAFYIIVYLVTLPGELANPTEFTVEIIGGEDWSQQELESSANALGVSTTTLATIFSSNYFDLPAFLIYSAIGLFLFWKKPDDWVAISISLYMVSVSNRTGLLAGISPIFPFIDNLTASFTSVLLFLIFFIFPDGSFTPRWMRWVALYSTIIQLWRLFDSQAYDTYAFFLLLPSLAAMVFSLIYRYTRVASPGQRLQIKWIVFLNGIGIGALVTVLASYAIFPQTTSPGPVGLVSSLVGVTIWRIFYSVLFPVSFALAILRSRLWDIDVIIRKTLVYSLLSGLLGLVYFGGVALLQGILTADRGLQTAVSGQAMYSSQPSAVVIVVTTLLIASLFNPLRRRLQDIIDRRFYRQKYNAETALSKFAEAARSETNLPALTHSLVSVVQETVQPEEVKLWLKP